jgi:hypothetical protein
VRGRDRERGGGEGKKAEGSRQRQGCAHRRAKKCLALGPCVLPEGKEGPSPPRARLSRPRPPPPPWPGTDRFALQLGR